MKTKTISPLEKIMGKRTLTRGAGIKVKVEPMTLERLMARVENSDNGQYDYSGPDGEGNSESSISCGVIQLFDLSPATSPKEQALYLASIMGLRRVNRSGIQGYQVILSDVVGEEAWAATKAAAFQGPITVNPNTGNKIQIYIVTADCLVDIYNSEI